MRRDFWRLIVWNAGKRAGYAILEEDAIMFTNDWRMATTLDTRDAWASARESIRRMGTGWSSTPLNAPRTVRDAEVAA